MGLYTSIGGGFGVTAALFSVAMDMQTYQCCDESNTKHLMTVASFCFGQEIGLAVKGGSRANIGENLKLDKCPQVDDTKSWRSSHGSAVWGSVILLGRSYDIAKKESGTIFGLGGGYQIWKECHNHIVADVPIGSCDEDGCEK